MRFFAALLLAFLAFQTSGQVPPAEPCVTHVETLHYPELARNTRIQGEVKVSAMVDETGKVILPAVSSGHPLFNDVVLDNIRRWKFQPPPSSFTIDVTYEFVLNGEVESCPPEEIVFDLPHHVKIVTSAVRMASKPSS
jgi:TonB family protein